MEVEVVEVLGPHVLGQFLEHPSPVDEVVRDGHGGDGQGRTPDCEPDCCGPTAKVGPTDGQAHPEVGDPHQERVDALEVFGDRAPSGDAPVRPPRHHPDQKQRSSHHPGSGQDGQVPGTPAQERQHRHHDHRIALEHHRNGGAGMGQTDSNGVEEYRTDYQPYRASRSLPAFHRGGASGHEGKAEPGQHREERRCPTSGQPMGKRDLAVIERVVQVGGDHPGQGKGPGQIDSHQPARGEVHPKGGGQLGDAPLCPPGTRPPKVDRAPFIVVRSPDPDSWMGALASPR
jgi:hypothetical protein